MEYQVEEGLFSEDGLMGVLTPILDNVYSDMRMTLKYTKYISVYYHPSTGRDYRLSNREMNLSPKQLNSIITFTITQRGKYQTDYISVYSVPEVGETTEDEIPDLMSQDQKSSLDAALAALDF